MKNQTEKKQRTRRARTGIGPIDKSEFLDHRGPRLLITRGYGTVERPAELKVEVAWRMPGGGTRLVAHSVLGATPGAHVIWVGHFRCLWDPWARAALTRGGIQANDVIVVWQYGQDRARCAILRPSDGLVPRLSCCVSDTGQ